MPPEIISLYGVFPKNPSPLLIATGEAIPLRGLDAFDCASQDPGVPHFAPKASQSVA